MNGRRVSGDCDDDDDVAVRFIIGKSGRGPLKISLFGL